MTQIYPIILAGGTGTRLWPLSRKSFPKQFSKLIGKTTLFQASAQRLSSSGVINFAQLITLTNSEFRFIIGEQLQEIGIDPGSILIEPEVKNTAAPILAGSIFALASDQNAIVLVTPSDHMLPDTEQFHDAILAGLPYLESGKIITFGVKPTSPHTGYGYLELTKVDKAGIGVSNVVRFIEKPGFHDAEKMVGQGNYLWNAGIFLFRARDMLDAFELYAPDTLEWVSKAVEHSSVDLGFRRLAREPWSVLENVSIDYAIMEKAQNLIAVPYTSKWSDLGGWDAVWSESNPDSSGNVISKFAHSIECTNSLLRSEIGSQQIVGIGLDNIVAVAMPDAVLVANKDCAQDVKKAVELLKSKDVAQAEIFPKNHRPWGWFESLAVGDRFQVKRISVKPGESLSLQSHKQRSEHWVVVEGTAKVTIEDDVKLITEGQSVYVPLGSKHRMENPGKRLMILIEVQIGNYLGEDDIVRYEDNYSR